MNMEQLLQTALQKVTGTTYKEQYFQHRNNKDNESLYIILTPWKTGSIYYEGKDEQKEGQKVYCSRLKKLPVNKNFD